VTAGDNPGRMRSEAGFAMLCGVAPLPASSRQTTRHRLNRGGDWGANAPCTWQQSAGCGLTLGPARTSPAAGRTGSPNARSSAAQAVHPRGRSSSSCACNTWALTHMRASKAANTRRSASGSAAARWACGRRWARSRTPTTALAESFFATLECELLDCTRFKSHVDARLVVFEFIEGWHNPHRRHSALDYLSPLNYERSQPTAHGLRKRSPVHGTGATPRGWYERPVGGAMSKSGLCYGYPPVVSRCVQRTP
jgi:transposase InsO family protein